MPTDDTQPTRIIQDEHRTRSRLTHCTAELQSLRQAAEREVRAAEERGRDAILLELVRVLDRLDAKASTQSALFASGLDSAIDELIGVLQRLGVTRIDARPGAPFDRLRHEATERVDDPSSPAGTVFLQRAPGYLVGERVLRPAQVVLNGPAGVEGHA